MVVLGIDGAGSTLSVGLIDDHVLGEYVVEGGRQRGRRMVPMLSSLLSDTGYGMDSVEGIAVTSGPGSFTGVRIGLATAGAIAYARKIPLVLVTTLEALAWQASDYCPHVAAMIPAGRGLVYGGRFEVADDVRLIGDVLHGMPGEVAKSLVTGSSPVLMVGSGWDIDLARAVIRRDWIQAGPPGLDRIGGAAVAGLGQRRLAAGRFSDPFALEPVYIARPGIGKGADRS